MLRRDRKVSSLQARAITRSLSLFMGGTWEFRLRSSCLDSHPSSSRFVADGEQGLRDALDAARATASEAIDNGARIVVISDRNSDEVFAPIPSLLLTSAVHHHLIREKKRTQVGLIVERDIFNSFAICVTSFDSFFTENKTERVQRRKESRSSTLIKKAGKSHK